jgi:hypothetical protein
MLWREKMNYRKIYRAFIRDRRRKEKIVAKQPHDRHHIKPKCLGGTNARSNLIRLSFGDHLFAHLLLAKIYPDSPLLLAAKLMTKRVPGLSGKVARKKYTWLCRRVTRYLSKQGKRTWLTRSRVVSPAQRQHLLKLSKNQPPASAETRVKLSIAGKRRVVSKKLRRQLAISVKRSWLKRKRHLTKAQRQKIKDGMSSPEFRKRLSDIQKQVWSKRKNRRRSKKSRAKAAASMKRFYQSKKNRQRQSAAMKRWHANRKLNLL